MKEITRFLLLLISISATCQTALLPLEGNGISTIEIAALTDRLRSELVTFSNQPVLERNEMEAILEEQRFQMSGCVTSECIVDVGEILGAEFMIAGSISHIGNLYTISLRMIEVESSNIVNSASYDHLGTIESLIMTGLRNVTRLLIASEDGNTTNLDEQVEYYVSGSVKAQGTIINDKKNGKWLFYHESGTLKSIGNFRNDEKHGKWIYYDVTGHKRDEGFFSNGVKNGQWTYYAVDHKKRGEGTYSNDVKNGQWTYYNTGGHKKEEGVYVQGVKSGQRTYYDIAGHKKEEGSYIQGMKNGQWTGYWPSGIVAYTGLYLEDQYVGEWKITPNSNTYSPDSSNCIASFMDGNIFSYLVKYSNGSSRILYNFAHGDISAIWWSDWDGNFRNSLSYRNSSNKPYIMYNSLGNKLGEGEIDNIHLGEYMNLRYDLVGAWKYFDTTGTVILDTVYQSIEPDKNTISTGIVKFVQSLILRIKGN